MKRAAWVVTVICVVALADLLLFGLYIPPLVWHARHGNYVELQGIRYRLPLLYLEHSTVRNELYIRTTLHRFPRKAAEITLGPRKIALFMGTDEAMRDLGMQRASNRKLTVAGHEGTCVEYAPAVLSRTVHLIQCTFAEGLNVQFMGTQNAIPDFYAILESGEAVQGRH